MGGRCVAAVGDRLLVASSGAGGVLTSVHRPSAMKQTIGARGMLLGAVGSRVAKTVAVGALCIAVCLDHLLDLEALGEEEEAGEELVNVVGVNRDN